VQNVKKQRHQICCKRDREFRKSDNDGRPGMKPIMMPVIERKRAKVDESGHELSARRTSGMTLLEVMIAVVIIAVAMSGTYSCFINAQRMNAVSREESIAQAAICQMIAQIRASRFDDIANCATGQANPAGSPPGFSGGLYYASGMWPTTVASDGFTLVYPNRMLPGVFPVNVNGEGLPFGVAVSLTPQPGFVQVGARYYGPGVGQAEMRVMIVNDEDPVEQEIGEVNGNQDGCDLDQDGKVNPNPYFVPDVVQLVPAPTPWPPAGSVWSKQSPSVFTPGGPEALLPIQSSLLNNGTGSPYNLVSYNAFPPATAPNSTDPTFSSGGATPLFPRHLASGTTGKPPQHCYLNINQMLVLPICVQVRWWSAAGVPREITVITFITNRS
jgi:prepilin-type N-terminal cleavage/methylation domain-containing protein